MKGGEPTPRSNRLDGVSRDSGQPRSRRSRVVRDQVRDKLAFSFEDMGEQQVKNIARPIRVHRILLRTQPSPSKPATGESTKPSLVLPDKPSIAVLPFQNMSGDPEQEYFADGVVEEITAAFCRGPPPACWGSSMKRAKFALSPSRLGAAATCTLRCSHCVAGGKFPPAGHLGHYIDFVPFWVMPWLEQ